MDTKTEDAQIIEDKTSMTSAKLEALAEEVKDKDPAMADDLKKLAKSKLSMQSFDDYMKLKATVGRDKGIFKHKAKVLAKRRAAAKAAKKARKANRRRK